MDLQVPGGVYLCQVSDTVSCGACCGLYNVVPAGADALTRILARRTERFQAIERTLPALDAFAREVEAMDSRQRPFPDFHHCPYLGLIGDGRSRVGCLLHPLGAGNQGVDFRGLSHYGGMACRVFFCTTVHCMKKRYKQILRNIADEWYLYGLIVTETALVTVCLDHVETRLGSLLNPNEPLDHKHVAEALRALLGLKLDWPFRPDGYDTPCHDVFNEKDHSKPAIDYTALGTSPSGVDAILYQLVSAFDDADQLRQAEIWVEQRVAQVVQSVEASRATP